MADILARSSEWLESKRHALRTVPVTYSRGEASAVLPATIGKTVFEQQGDYGVIERTESRDFLLRTEDLVLEGANTLPERGDRVRETAGGGVYVYEVMAPGKEPHFRYSDPRRRTLRIHTKQIDLEEA